MSSASSSRANRRKTACTDGRAVRRGAPKGRPMARISPAAPEQFAQVADYMERWRKTKGYPPNSWLTMARKPRVFRAYRELHTAENAAHIASVPIAKVEALPQFRTSPLFSLAERVALDLASAAGACPPRVTD